jgi:hypothetical protein
MVTRAARGLGSIVPSYSMSWAAVGEWARPVTIPCHVGGMRVMSRVVRDGTTPPGARASLARGPVCINSIGRGRNSLCGVSRCGAGPLRVRQGEGCAPGNGRGKESGPRGWPCRDPLPWGRARRRVRPWSRARRISPRGSVKAIS